MKSNKEIKSFYKNYPFKKGIYQIINRSGHKTLVLTSTDLDRAFNLHLFQLKAGLHTHSSLQHDWDRLGADNFAFEILDEVKFPDTTSAQEIRNELMTLAQLYATEMQKSGWEMY